MADDDFRPDDESGLGRRQMQHRRRQFLRRAEASERDLALDLGGHGVECGTSPSNAAARIGF